MKNTIHMLKSVTNTQMMSFVITTEDGKVMLIDGGWRQDAAYLLEYLRTLTGQAVPHVDAIWLTHPHSDHILAFLELLDNHRDAFTFDRVYYNFPSVQFIRQEDNDYPTLEAFYAHLPLFEDVDIIQVGARNMQNFELLKHLGKTNKPILLKRGLANTLEELLMSAEYIMSEGNERVILCERGIRTFETATRNTLDISAVPMLRSMTHLPVVVDPSHATGKSMLVPSMALAGVIAGADGLIIEVHNNPSKALCDGAQSLTPAQFDDLEKRIAQIKDFAYRP